MRISRLVSFGISAALLVLVGAALASGGDGAAKDPFAAEIARWKAVLNSHPDTDPMWAQMKEGSQPLLDNVEEALQNGRRLLALQRFALVQANLGAAVYVSERPAEQHKDMTAFDAEWKRMGGVLHDDLGTPSATTFAGLPALVRGLAETSLPQVRTYYQASLDYAHSTAPDPGLFYLGNAQAQRDLVSFYRTLAAPSSKPAPSLRSIRPEIDALQTEMLAAYRPPLSIDNHDEFITASSLLKEARELDAAGLRFGALLRYLQAARLFALMHPAAPALTADALSQRLGELATRLNASNVDNSLGQLFLESAQADVAKTTPGSASVTASVMANDVLPRYFAALAPAPAQPKVAAVKGPQVTVTLVRWPYT